MKIKFEWKEVTRKLEELIPYEHNPRKFNDKGMDDLGKSIDKFGLAEPIIINTDNVIIGGHARYFVLLKRGEQFCKCYVPNKMLTPKEVQELNIRLNKNVAGEFDFDILTDHFDFDDLIDWGFEENEFNFSNYNPQNKEKEIPDDGIETKNECPNCGYKW